jgi:hypothetical protein
MNTRSNAHESRQRLSLICPSSGSAGVPPAWKSD